MLDESRSDAFVTFQLQAYDRLAQSVTDFDLIEKKEFPSSLIEGMLVVLSAFKRGYIFFDTQTANIFNEKISIPWRHGDFNGLLIEIGGSSHCDIVYDTMRERLSDTMECARNFLKKKFPDCYG